MSNPIQYIEAPCGQTAVYDRGVDRGGTVLLIHGLSYPHMVWGPLVERLTTCGYRVISYDLYGRGNSLFIGDRLTSTELADQALFVLKALNIVEAVYVIGLSNSDLVIMDLLVMHPHRFRGAVLIAPSGIDPRTMNPWMRWLCRTFFIRRVFGHWLRFKLSRRMQQHKRHLPLDSPQHIHQIYHWSSKAMYDNPTFIHAICSQIAGMRPNRLLSQVDPNKEKDSPPITLLHFAEEVDCKGGALVVYDRCYPNVQRRYLSHGGHMALLEYPDLVYDAVREALS